MQTFQLVGTFSFSDNIKLLKIGDIVKLLPNADNKQNKNAIGVYMSDMRKIGYLPFTLKQIDSIKKECRVAKIDTSQNSATIIISRQYDDNNFLLCEPKTIINERNHSIQLIEESNNDIRDFKKYLENNKHIVHSIGYTFQTEDFIDLYIKTFNEENIFNTVTRKYYDENIFKYDEFFNFGLIGKSIFQQFKIHRLENYIEKNYELVKLSRKILKFNIIQLHDPINGNHSMNDIKIAIKYLLSMNLMYKEYIDKIDIIKYFENYKTEIRRFFSDYNITELVYDHRYQKYYYLNLYNENNIVIIDICKNFDKLLSMIGNRKIYIYNPIEGKIYY